jgi:hypothetical protein
MKAGSPYGAPWRRESRANATPMDTGSQPADLAVVFSTQRRLIVFPSGWRAIWSCLAQRQQLVSHDAARIRGLDRSWGWIALARELRRLKNKGLQNY